MKPIEVKEYFISLYKFSKQTGMSYNSLKNWLKWEYIPIESQYKIQELTKGKLKAKWEDVKHDD